MSTDDNNSSKATIRLLVDTESADNVVSTEGDPGNNAASVNIRKEAGAAGENIRIVKIRERLRSANMLVRGSKLGLDFQDQYRRIKRPLLSNAFGKTSSLVENGNLILVDNDGDNEYDNGNAIADQEPLPAESGDGLSCQGNLPGSRPAAPRRPPYRNVDIAEGL